MLGHTTRNATLRSEGIDNQTAGPRPYPTPFKLAEPSANLFLPRHRSRRQVLDGLLVADKVCGQSFSHRAGSLYSRLGRGVCYASEHLEPLVRESVLLIFTVTTPPLFAGPSVAAAVAGRVRPRCSRRTTPQFTFEGHWALNDAQAITVNSGSTLRFRFTGDQLAARFDTGSITVPSQLYVTIDGGSPALVKVDRDRIVLVDQLDDGVVHTAEIAVKDVDERV